jgi:hypothetical protein
MLTAKKTTLAQYMRNYRQVLAALTAAFGDTVAVTALHGKDLDENGGEQAFEIRDGRTIYTLSYHPEYVMESGRKCPNPVWAFGVWVNFNDPDPQSDLRPLGEDVSLNAAIEKLATSILGGRIQTVFMERQMRPPVSDDLREYLERSIGEYRDRKRTLKMALDGATTPRFKEEIKALIDHATGDTPVADML